MGHKNVHTKSQENAESRHRLNTFIRKEEILYDSCPLFTCN